MSPYAVIFNIAIITAIIGIIVYWVQRFAVFRGYKAIESEIYVVANRLDTKPVREAGDVLLAGTYSRIPTVVRFSHRLDRPGLYMQMRVPATFGLVVMPKTEKRPIEGRVLMRTGSQLVDARFNARSNDPVEVRMLLAGADARQYTLCETASAPTASFSGIVLHGARGWNSLPVTLNCRPLFHYAANPYEPIPAPPG